MGKIKDLTGQRFGRLTVIERAGTYSAPNCRSKSATWRCKCDCGNESVLVGNDLSRGATKSCGCLFEENTHKKRNTRLYITWRNMKQRCYNPNNVSYRQYGGRGIEVCEEWKSNFLAFYNWAMANGYADNLTIDRIDVNGNYEPDNCRWASVKEQNNNKSSNHLITYKGKTQTIKQWAEELGISSYTICSRLNQNWDIERALTEKPRRRGKS